MGVGGMEGEVEGSAILTPKQSWGRILPGTKRTRESPSEDSQVARLSSEHPGF